MTIIKIQGSNAIAQTRGVETSINISLVPDAKIGDKVIIHAGFAIEILDPEEAKKTEELWAEYRRSLDSE